VNEGLLEGTKQARGLGDEVPAPGLPETPIASRLANASCAPSFYDPKDI
jgi:hypothetical protein